MPHHSSDLCVIRVSSKGGALRGGAQGKEGEGRRMRRREREGGDEEEGEGRRRRREREGGDEEEEEGEGGEWEGMEKGMGERCMCSQSLHVLCDSVTHNASCV